MKVIIESKFPVRGQDITTYYSFPIFSPHIEETMCRALEFLKQYQNFTLTMEITNGH